MLWLDHGGWLGNQSSELPPPGARQYMGHAKVIAGYDDQDTPDPGDDLCLIYDPYWLPQGDVLGDLPNDIFLVPQAPIQ